MVKAHTPINWENEPSYNTPLNAANLNKMDSEIGILDDRIIEQDTIKLDKSTANTMVKAISFNENTGVFTITLLNGSTTKINTKLEKVVVNFGYDANTQQIILNLVDGTTQYIDLSALITQYEFLNSDTIAWEVTADGKVKAKILDGSITENMLQPNYLAEIKVESAKAETNAIKSQSYAVGGTESRQNEDIDNARYYYEQAKSISESFSGALVPMGTVSFEDLPSLEDAVSGWMYNISNEFVTTDEFKEGAGYTVPLGANVFKTFDGFWDVLAGSPVTGIKGSSETSYRRGNVNITASNIGLGNVNNTSDADKPVSTAMQTALDKKVDKVEGKGLSANDYTTTEKNKLYGIASGAEVNQNAFSNVKVGDTTISADAKTDTLTLVAGDNVTITPDATNDKVTIKATDTTYSSFVKSGSSAKTGLVPAPSTTAGTTKFLREDATWATPALTSCSGTLSIAQGGTGATTAKGAQYNLLKDMAESTAAVTDDTITVCKYTEPDSTKGVILYKKTSLFWDYIKSKADSVYAKNNAMTGATSSAAGKTGLVPAPAAGKQASFLRGDGTWTVPPKVSVANNLTTTSTGMALDATQGKALNDKITTLNSNLEKTPLITIGGTYGNATLHFSSSYLTFVDGVAEMSVSNLQGVYGVIAWTNSYNGINIISSYNSSTNKITFTAKWSSSEGLISGGLTVESLIFATN